MPAPADFDQLYLDSRRRLVLQAFALTGDLGAARGAVRDAFVAARQHWRKVGRLDDPESWVRARSWSVAQRRSVARVWHREKELDAAQQQVLAALHGLPDVQRKTLILNHLAALSLTQIAREIGETRERAELHLQQATSAMVLALDSDSTAIRLRLESLAPVARRAGLPRVTTLHRDGTRRRRLRAVLGAAVAVAVAVAAGAVVTSGSDLRPGETAMTGILAGPRPGQGDAGASAGTTDARATRTATATPATTPAGSPVTPAMLLDADQLGRSTGTSWEVRSTSDNTGGSGLHTPCQQQRFADPHGVAALVRTFAPSRGPRRTAVQQVEVSRNVAAATRTYNTVLGWYSGCTAVRTQLVAAYRVTGVGDAARVLLLRLPDHRPGWYVVGLARSGAVTTWTVVGTDTGRPGRSAGLGDGLAAAVQDLCRAGAAAGCAVGHPPVTASYPPPAGDRPGMLAAVDLPPVPHVHRAWVGTRPAAPTGGNMAATPCDHTDFGRLGADRALTRTFLVPQARLPQRFGLTETFGTFPGAGRATRVMSTIEQRMARCSRAGLGATVHHALVGHAGGGSSYALWRLDVEISANRTVGYWMGLARQGRYLAQVTFSPVPGKDVSAPVFRALVERALARLHELPR